MKKSSYIDNHEKNLENIHKCLLAPQYRQRARSEMFNDNQARLTNYEHTEIEIEKPYEDRDQL